MKDNSRKYLSSMDLSWLSSQLNLVIKSGVPLANGLEMIADCVGDGRSKKIFKTLSDYVLDNIPLSEALVKCGGFPNYYVNMVQIGETTGSLDLVMENLANYYEQDSALRKRLRSALTYPVMLAVLMGAIIILLLVRVLPIFNDIMKSLGGELPAFTVGLMNFGTAIAKNPVVTLVIIILAVALIWIFTKTPVWTAFKERMAVSFPGIRTLCSKIYTSRFSLSMSYMLKSGVDMDTALKLTEITIGNSIISAKIDEARKGLERGEDPLDLIAKTGIFPKLFVHIMLLGRKTGDLDNIMSKVARTYETEVGDSLSKLTGIVEPLLVVLLSAVIGAILLTVMLPLISIMSTIG